MTEGRLVRITGSLAEATRVPGAGLYDLARVGERGLLGEVIRIEGETLTLQVYEETTGLVTGEPVQLSGHAMQAQLGPGLLGSILDGVGRPLGRLAQHSGAFIQPGVAAPTLDPDQRWEFRATAQPGQVVRAGDILGTVLERGSVEHRVLVPPGIEGTLKTISSGARTVHEVVAELESGPPLRLAHSWPVRVQRPVRARLADDRPFVTGQRVLDFLFPAAEGGTVAVPGGFGTGKTIIEHSLAKHADVDIVVYVGCGERGNEMAEALHDFPLLLDERTGRSIMDRTVMVVNTSNMPVAAREASVYLGVTIAEFYRDMGYRVALLADSLSRWAEALREIGSRLAEMPGEEGYPTYLASRLGQFYERAGRVRTMGAPDREGSLTIVAAVSPPGGDFSEPVTQATLRVAGTLWALDPALAHQRQFPAVDWATSYSLHAHQVAPRLAEASGPEWSDLRKQTLELLQRGRELKEISGLVGPEALQDADRLLLEAARMIQEIVLSQNAYDPNDAASSLLKTYQLARATIGAYHAGNRALAAGLQFERLDLEPLRRALGQLRRAPAEGFDAQLATVTDRISRLGEAASP